MPAQGRLPLIAFKSAMTPTATLQSLPGQFLASWTSVRLRADAPTQRGGEPKKKTCNLQVFFLVHTLTAIKPTAHHSHDPPGANARRAPASRARYAPIP